MFESVPENQVNIDLGGTFKFKGDMTKMAAIDLGNLDKEVAQHPTEFSWLSSLAAKANEVFEEAESTRKLVEAEALIHYRETLSKGDKLPPEYVVKAMVEADDKVQAAKAQERVAERNKELCKGFLDAYRTRKDLIVAAIFGGMSEKKNTTIPQTAQELTDTMQAMRPRRRAAGTA